MKIAFVDVKPKLAGWSFGWLKRLSLIGQLYLGTILRERGHKVDILKESLIEIKLSDFEDYDFICFSAMSSQVPRVKKWTNLIKTYYPDKKIILGGIHATFRPQDFPEADHIVLGEGESVIADLIEGKIKKRIIKSSPIENLNTLPFPDYSLFKGVKNIKIYPASSSRGCPFHCNFCSVTEMFGKKYRFREVDNVIKELELMKKPKRVIFYDDNFCSNKQRTKDLLKKMIDKGLTPSWWGEARLDIAKDEKLLKLISESNNLEMAIGFESTNPKVLEHFNKGQKYEDIIYCIKKMKDFGIKIKGFFIGGSDYDQKGVFTEIEKFIDKYELDTATLACLTPYPGSSMFKEFEKDKRIFVKDWGIFDAQHVVFKPKNMTAYELQLDQVENLKKYYKKRFWSNVQFALNDPFGIYNNYKEFKKWHKQTDDYLDFLKKLEAK
ncbi:MAG: radical SAM protein [archaeon]